MTCIVVLIKVFTSCCPNVEYGNVFIFVANSVVITFNVYDVMEEENRQGIRLVSLFSVLITIELGIKFRLSLYANTLLPLSILHVCTCGL